MKHVNIPYTFIFPGYQEKHLSITGCEVHNECHFVRHPRRGVHPVAVLHNRCVVSPTVRLKIYEK